MSKEPSVLLLGLGNVLSQAEKLLPPKSFVATSRDRSKVSELRSQGILAEQLDLLVPESIPQLFSKYPAINTIVDSVPPIRVPAETSINKLTASSGVENLLNTANLPPLRQLIYLSTTGVFGRQDGSWVNEESTSEPFSPSSQARLEVEQLYQSVLGERFCALRLPAIYGPGRGLATMIKSGGYCIKGDLQRFSNRIHEVDAARAVVGLIKLSQSGQPLPPLLTIADDQPTPLIDVVQYICKLLNAPLPALQPSSTSSGGYYEFELLNQRVSNKRIKDLLKLELLYPTFKEGIASELRLDRSGKEESQLL